MHILIFAHVSSYFFAILHAYFYLQKDLARKIRAQMNMFFAHVMMSLMAT